jgi:hypothetical protein
LLERWPLGRGDPVHLEMGAAVSPVPILATVSRSAAVIAAPMLDIRPVSSAARIAFEDILRSVSGSGAPMTLPALWQVEQRD